jgi:NADPH:quinone reductase-like Zn-dependent oxidoreductase
VETDLKPGDWVLVQGSGGVSVVALQLARMMGCRVIATSSSDAKLERLGALGAEHLINYKTHANWGEQAFQLTGNTGVDLVVEVGGPGNLPQSINALAVDGCISLIGVLTGWSGEVPTAALMTKNGRLSGITVGSQADHANMIAAVEANDLQPVIDRTFALEELGEAFRYQESQQHFGKICVSL